MFVPPRAAASAIVPWLSARGLELTVVAKLTFELRPVECALVPEAEPLATADIPLAQETSLLSLPHDLAPFKPALDVILVGRARALPGATLTAGSLRKTVRRSTAELFALAPTHAIRSHRAGTAARAWVQEAVPFDPWPTEADSRFFNVAPEDQRLASVAGEDIVLSGLIDGVPRFVTRLPNVSPAATALLSGKNTVVELRMDTVAIDLDRGRVMVSWRAQIGRLTSSSQVELRFDPLAPAILVQLPAASPGLSGKHTMADNRASGVLSTLPMASPPLGGPLPFRDSPSRPAPPPEKVEHIDTGTKVLLTTRAARPEATAPKVPPPAAPPAPGPIPRGLVRFPDTMQHPPALDLDEETASEGAQTLAAMRSPLDLLWMDTSAAERARAAKLPTKNFRGQDADSCPDRRLVLDILGEATRPGALELQDALLQRLLDELEPPVVAISGELTVAYDEIETLLIMRSMARAAAWGDRAIDEVLDSIDKVADRPAALPVESAVMLRTRLDAALEQSGRARDEQLQTAVQRTLGEQRAYQRRHVFGSLRVRGGVATGKPPDVIAYLPEAAAAQLPLHRIVSVCLLGVVRGVQDPKEACPIAVDVIALARRVVSATSTA